MAHALCEAARMRRGGGLPPIYSTSANGNVLSQCARSAAFRSMIEAADIIDADGQPLVVASRLMTQTPIPQRCATTDFFHDVAAAAVRRDLSMYLLGATEEVNAAAAARATALHPGLKIAGRRNGYFNLEDEGAVVDAINHVRPDFLWVGLGVPREQQFVLRNRERLTGVGVVKTCGGLFDFLSGRASRAPQWMQDWSLEWAYRLSREPRRLLWRYATTNVHTLALLARHTRDLERRGV
ncbi:MAG: WecB/TagA/CpsF family glycosyltransferase [Gammaproteobacteria bacterium]|nr:WecB/TagA/CpsF family glycosyltransferase [Gammaproteobacteria bacterium]